jgi:uncharacterized protein
MTDRVRMLRYVATVRLAALVLAAALALHGAAGAAAPLVGQAVQQGAFVVRMGGDTLAIENYTRAADRIEGEITGRALGRMVYTASLGPAGTVTELTLQAWMPGVAPAVAPQQRVHVAFAADSVIVVVTGAAGEQTQRLPTQPGAIPYLNPSFALLERVLERARSLGGEAASGDVVNVPLFLLQGGQTVVASVAWLARDSAAIAIAGSVMNVAVDAGGSITAAAAPAQQLTAVHVSGAHLPAFGREPPDYSAPAGAPYTAENVTVHTPAGHVLVGTLTRPAAGGAVPAMIMITGSGAQDRDQAIPLLHGYRPFRQIADTLGRRGIAVLRLDDRGFGASTGDHASATSADFADDVRAALDYLRGRDDIDATRLGLVGHSEGGLIAPMVAATDTALRALVLIAGPAQSGREIIEYQQRYAIEHASAIPAASRDSAFAAAQRSLEASAARLPWMRFFLDHDPLPVARRVPHAAVLVIHGETDRQVTVDQATRLAAAFREAGNPDVTVRTFPDVNHLLLRDADGNAANYITLPDRAVVPDVLGAIADWLAARFH